jgi:hypothetical protein
MATLKMGQQSYSFDAKTIEVRVQKNKIGNYGLGFVKDDSFKVRYVGRSDSDLQSELKDKLSTKSKTRQRFKFTYASSPKEAFEKECTNYHDYIEYVENEIHSPRPKGKDYPCPISDCPTNSK